MTTPYSRLLPAVANALNKQAMARSKAQSTQFNTTRRASSIRPINNK